MYRGINLKEKNDSFKATLMKNIREPLGEINRDYIDEINYNFKDLHDMSLTVPNKVFDKGQILVEPIYTQFLSKLQQIIIDLGDKKDRFVVAESEREDEFYTGQDGKTIKYKTKKLKCYSYEYTLKDKNLDLYEDVYRQLYYDENEHPTNGDAIDISEGMLNMFESQTGWRVKTITDKAKREYSKAKNQFYIDIPNVTFTNLQKGTTIWEKDFNFSPATSNDYIDIKLVYGKIITTDSNGKELKRERRSHDLEKIYTGVRHIKAVYNSTSDYQNAMIYTITLSDGMVITKVQEFGYLQNSNVIFQETTLSYTDGSEDTINVIKHRSFDKGSYSWLDFLRQDISNAFNVYVSFDTINLEISVYSHEEVGEHKGISMSYEDSIKTINKKDGYEDIVNKLTVTSEKASIAEVNLFGGVDYILDYSYHYKYGFSDELKVAWDRYITSLESKQDRVFELRVESNTNTKLKTKIESEKKAIDTTVRSLQVARTTAIKEDIRGSMKDEIANLTTQINTKMDRFNLLATQIATIKADQDRIDEELQLLSKQMTFQYAEDSNGLIFTDELIVEIDAWTICEETSDENYTTSFGLYEEYKDRLAERNKLKVDIEVDSEGVLQNLFIPPDLEWDYYIKLGDFVDIIADEEQDDYDDRIGLYIGTEGKEDSLLEKGMRLVSFKYIPKEHDIPSLNFTNKDEKADIFSGASNIGKTMDKAQNYMSTTKEILNQSASVNDFINSMLYGDGMDNRILPIRNRSGRVKYDQTEAGMYLIDAENEDHQLYLGAGILAFTSDRWLTSNCALNEEGLTARFLVGEVICGKKLYITNDNGDEFYIGNIKDHRPDNTGTDFGIRIADQLGGDERIFLGLENVNGVRKARLRLRSSGGDHQLVLSEDGIVLTNQFSLSDNVDENHPMKIPFRAMEGVTRYEKVLLTLDFYPYRAFERGMSTAPSSVQGSTTSSGGGYVNSVTSSGGGSFNSTSTSDGGGAFISTISSETSLMVSWGPYQLNSEVPVTTNVNGDLVCSGSDLIHHHDIQMNIPNHSHNVNFSQPAHSHSVNVTIPDHSHSVNVTIPSHTHDLEYKIFESDTPSQANVYVNGNSVGQVGNHGVVDIASYLNIGQMNEINISTGGNGRIVANISSKFWQTW